jgi:hypothetical protein
MFIFLFTTEGHEVFIGTNSLTPANNMFFVHQVTTSFGQTSDQQGPEQALD